jgi:RNA polymerase-binding transcription factor DksA
MIDTFAAYQQRLEQTYRETEHHLDEVTEPTACERWRQKLIRIEQALERLHNGSFGQCLSCGAAVSRARLKALVYAEFCLSCQQEYEQQFISP